MIPNELNKTDYYPPSGNSLYLLFLNRQEPLLKSAGELELFIYPVENNNDHSAVYSLDLTEPEG